MAVIEVTDLRKRYGDRTVVDDVSFAVHEGEIFGILGPNGAGKTTTVECIEGLRTPDDGTVRVLGHDPLRDGTDVRRLLGAQLQDSKVQGNLEVGEALAMFASFYDDPADADDLLDLLGLAEHRRVRFRKLSGGQQQRLAIALALIGRPRVAVFDELTTGLDPQARRDTWRLVETIRDRGVTIVLVTHFMEEAERLCDRVAVLDRGRVVALDTPAGLIDRVGGEQQLRFVPSKTLDDAALRALPEVTGVDRRGDQVVVTGNGEVVHAVTALLARAGIVARGLRIDQRNLDDAFVALTGHDPSADATPEEDR
ncbi:MAG TPA: ABC transporter ATP-binding protein [Egicoccus sp.]|nr:ABC transporter ATP-binding protein [Egicoccus sp.]HSK24310.1 ABC transporter ATP-binding protein [Egicoccus sp.]